MACILDSAIQGRIDQVNLILELDQEPQGSARQVLWTNCLIPSPCLYYGVLILEWVECIKYWLEIFTNVV